MSDRELLEMAAKAAGYDVVFIHDDKIPMRRNIQNHKGMKIWNPLADDGDALRLGARFGVFLRKDFIKTLSSLLGSGMEHDKATRLAIVVTVVDIYKRLPPKSAGG